MRTDDGTRPAFIRLTLSDGQRAQLRTATGHDASEIRLTPDELEERIAPRGWIEIEAVSAPIYR